MIRPRKIKLGAALLVTLGFYTFFIKNKFESNEVHAINNLVNAAANPSSQNYVYSGASINQSQDQAVDFQKSVVPDWDPNLNYNVHLFYYGWYGAPEVDGRWWHWNHRYLDNWDKNDRRIYPKGAHEPPDDIGSNFYPSLGPYSSRDPHVIKQHFQMIRNSNVGVISVSWYPPGTSDNNGPESDSLIPILLDVATDFSIKICLHVEPYKNRSVENLRENLQYVHNRYGSHPSFYKVKRGNRFLPVFYIYDSYLIPSTQWQRIFSNKGDLTVRGGDLDGIFIGLLVELQQRNNIKTARFDGFYTYFASNGFTYGSSWKNWRSLASFAYQNSLIFIPSVGPGYVDTRIRPWNSKNTRSRSNGTYYDFAWKTALSANPKYVSVTSFNEWHEGTQIEPAVPHTCCVDYRYEDFSPANPEYYLQRTGHFAKLHAEKER